MNRAIKQAADERLKQMMRDSHTVETTPSRPHFVTARSGNRVIAIRRARPQANGGTPPVVPAAPGTAQD